MRYAVQALWGSLLAVLALPAVSLGFGSGLTICEPPIDPVALSEPTVITDCSEGGIRAVLEEGGHITFDCGPGPATIPISGELRLSTETDTVIDGGGLITLDGQNRTRIFFKGWHDPQTVGTIGVTLQNIRIINGRAPSGDNHSGGALHAGHPGTRVHLINTTFENNATTDIHTPDNQGGAVYVHNAFETVISGAEFVGNRAGNGGAFGGIATGLLVFNSRFSSNGAVDDSTGGIVRGHGGAIHLDGVANTYNPDANKRVHVCGSVFEGNTSVRGGGALKVTVSDNKGTRATYEKCAFVNNSASGASGVEGHGGAVYHLEDDHDGGTGELNVEVLGCTFSNNSGWKQGGGAWLYALGRIEVVNSTFSANRVTEPEIGMGGGLVLSLGEAAVTNCTFARNYAWFHGGGIQASNNVSVTLQNSLFYFNESERDWGDYQMNRPADSDGGGNLQFPGERFNQSGTPDDGKVTPTVLIADPRLADLAPNGGPTRTMALKQGSPAINAGTPQGGPAADQRGVARDDEPDIGAFEFVPPGLTDVVTVLRICAGMPVAVPPHLADINADRAIGLPEAIHLLKVNSER